MKLPISSTRMAGWLAIVMLLQGCAAAAVIRKQPDFDEENGRRSLLQVFQVRDVRVASLPAENSPVSR
jgi:hypothetical protein